MPSLRRWRKRLQHRAEYALFRGAVFLCGRVSLKAARRFADGLGRFAFSVLRIRRSVTLSNLAMAFPERPERELRRIALQTYRNFSRTFIEFIRFPAMSGADFLSLCEVRGEEHLDWVKRNGKGALLVSGHFGSWEVVGPYLAQRGYPVSGIVGRQKNRRIDEAAKKIREDKGLRVIRVGASLRSVIHALRANEWVEILADQDAHEDGIFVDFMGRKASNHPGPAVFAIRTGAPILFGYGLRLPDGRFRVDTELLRFDEFKETTPENIRIITQTYTSLLEKAVREYPEQYFWMHKRWKTRPPQERSS
jgi:Kdo2-lipid IVA lauroyltransferase/acyltransferase